MSDLGPLRTPADVAPPPPPDERRTAACVAYCEGIPLAALERAPAEGLSTACRVVGGLMCFVVLDDLVYELDQAVEENVPTCWYLGLGDRARRALAMARGEVVPTEEEEERVRG